MVISTAGMAPSHGHQESATNCQECHQSHAPRCEGLAPGALPAYGPGPMKTRDSGMPEAGYWNTFFNPEAVLRTLGLDQSTGVIVDVGCGYGTFTLPAARLTGQRVIALDVESDLVRQLADRAQHEGLGHLVDVRHQDVAAQGTGLADAEAATVFLFNLLHCEQPVDLLREAHRILVSGGRVGVVHWRSDIATPRGPDLSIRPKPSDCVRWLGEAGFTVARPAVALPPYHFGLVGQRS